MAMRHASTIPYQTMVNGGKLNAYMHLHLCMLDIVIAPGRQGLAFRVAQVNAACVECLLVAVRHRASRLFLPHGLVSRKMVAVMQGWGHSGGFSMRAGGRIASHERRAASVCCDMCTSDVCW